MTKRVAVYAGSFDPFTNGHYEIVERGLQLFDELVILVAVSNTKKPLFSMSERVEMIKNLYANNPKVRVDFSEGLLVDYASKNNIGFILRGLRPTGDFDYEFHMASMNFELAKEIETVFFVTHKEHSCVSSSAIREIMACGGNVERFVPKAIYSYLVKRGSSCK